MTEANMDEVHPELRAAVKDFLLKSRYPFVMFLTGSYETYDVTNRVHYRTGVGFGDPKYADINHKLCGEIKLVRMANETYKYRVVNRSVVNWKARDNERRHSSETVNTKNLVKLLLKHVTPYSMEEIANENSSSVERAEATWRREFNNDAFDCFRMADREVMQELTNLLAQGAKFISPAFQKAAGVGMAMYEKRIERTKAVVNLHFVRFEGDNTISVHTKNKIGMNPSPAPRSFNSFDTLPEVIQQGVGMAKMLRDGETAFGLSTRVNERTFWVLEHVISA
jgi:hypothetical protein